jgi:hypothetical protein
MKRDIVYLLLFTAVALLLIIVIPILHPISVLKSELAGRRRQL